MKRFLTLLLAAAMVLSFAACGDNGTTIRNENEKDNVKKDPIAAQYLQDLAVKTADYPVLPAMPNESELDEAFSTIDYDKMGADAYEKAQEKIWEDWDARSNAYYDALKALRSKGTSYPAAFLHFTQETGTLLSAEENTVLSPANLYLAFAMLSETTDGDSRAQLLSLLGLENTDAPRAAGNYVWRNLYGETSTGKTLLGSSVWLNENVPYNEETLQVLAEQYLASTFSAPMGDEKTDKAIGEWINENTGNLLQDAAGGIETKPETVMLLLTTLYFKDQWRDEFWAKETRQDVFTAADGAQQTVDFMHLTQDRAAYCRGAKTTPVAELALFRRRAGDALPAARRRARALKLSCGTAAPWATARLRHGREPAQPANSIWSVPKFDVSSDLELNRRAPRAGRFRRLLTSTAADFFTPLSTLTA